MASFTCTSCSKTFETLGKHSYHQRGHTNEKNFLFICGVEACSQRFGTYGALNTHLNRQHKEFRTVEVPQPGNLRCSVDTCTALSVCDKDLCYHVLREHNRKGEAVKCPLSRKCHSESLLVNFQSHLSKYHRGWNTNNSEPLEPALNHNDADFEDSLSERRTQDAHDNSTFDQDSDQDPDVTFAEEEYHNKQDLIHNLAKFYLKMESEFILPASTVQSMSEGLSGLLEQNLMLIKPRLIYELKSLDLEPDIILGIVNRVIYADALYSAHDKSIAPGPWLCTDALRKAYYKKYFRYIEPVEKDLSFDRPTPTFVYYVPIEESLKVMLECPSVQKEVDKSFKRVPSEGIIRDYYDGLVYKERKRVRPEKTIDLFIFQDAFKPTNDSSPVASKHSTLGIYFSLGNLDPHHRTDLDAIQLLMVIPKYKKLFKDEVLHQRCLEVLVEDLQKLETDGIVYKGQNFPVNLVFMIGDNLGQHEIGGFIGSFSAEYFCRYCPITKTRYTQEPWATEPFRTKESYEEDMQTATRLNEADPSVVHYKGVKPVKFNCPFNALENYHVSDPGMAPCIAHDILSGVLTQDLPIIINHFVREGWVSYPRLNALLENFTCKGTDANNKPHEIPSNGTTLSGNAVQNWTLLRLLPFIIKKKKIKDCNDPYWKLYLSLKEICEYLFAPSYMLDQVSYMKSAIENYLCDRVILGFQKPKGHFLGHLADLIILLGPLILLWTLRFESIHSYFRSVSRASHNFVNPGKTMTKKHCLYLAYMSSGTFFQDGVIDPKISGKLNYESFLDAETVRVLLEQNFSGAAEVLESVVVNGIKYKEDKWTGWLLLGNLDEINIHIGKICCIVCDNNQITILLKTYIGRLLNEYGIYEISNTVLKQMCVSPLNLKSPCLQTVYTFGGRKCFSLKHTLSHDSDYFD